MGSRSTGHALDLHRKLAQQDVGAGQFIRRLGDPRRNGQAVAH